MSGMVLHWVLSDCVQRGRARGFEVACAPSMRELTCEQCKRDLKALRSRALYQQAHGVSHDQLEALRSANEALTAQVGRLKAERARLVDELSLCRQELDLAQARRRG